MTDSNKTFRKTNPLLGIILALLFVALGLYLYFVMAEQPGNSNTLLYKIVGAASVVFFGGLLLFAVYKKTRKS